MPYTKQTWIDSDATKPVSAARMSVIEDGIFEATHATPSAVQALTANGQTITVNSDTKRISMTGSYTGIILAAGTQDGQHLTILNQSNTTATFAADATSNVLNGLNKFVPAYSMWEFIWIADLSRWIGY